MDDEPLAREKIFQLLQAESGLEIIDQCGDGQSAVQSIEQKKPDLVFLDIQMPELNGFEVLGALEPDEIPVIVFVTAYDQYAIKAFEIHALDYLLKPFDRERFKSTLKRAREQLEAQNLSKLHEKISILLSERHSKNYPDRIAIKSSGKILFITIAMIDWIEAAGNYVKLHVGSEAHLHRETMNSLEEKLDPEQFARIHRSTIINLERIREIQPFFNGEHVVILKDNTKLTLSRRYRTKLQALIDQAL